MKRGKPLQRKTPMQRSPMRRAKVKSAYKRRERDFAYMGWVRRQPCCARRFGICSGRVEADHAGRRGVGRKADDRTCIALCSKHHRQRGSFAGPFKIWIWTQDMMRAWLEVEIISHNHEYTMFVVREKRHG